MAGTTSGWVLLLIAGTANATFGLPMKYVRGWEWENTWMAWSVMALIVLPVTLALVCIPSVASLYREAGPGTIAAVFLLGMGWGLAQVLFGKAMNAIGIGLAFSIVLGISAAIGSILPMLRLESGLSESAATTRIIIGLIFVGLGVTACAFAGRSRESAQSALVRNSRSFTPGLLMAISSGILASFMNLGIAFGSPLLTMATAQGATTERGMYAVWLPLLLGGAVPNLLYCSALLIRRDTLRRYGQAFRLRNVCLALVMALLWFFSTALYGVASQWLGTWGVVLGWPVFMSVIVITAGVLGIATGEWKQCGRKPVLLQLAGIGLLVLAIISFSIAQNSTRQVSRLRSVLPGFIHRSTPIEVYVR